MWKEIPIAIVYGVLTSISPVKKGRKQNYFKGTVCDESSTLRLLGFNTKLQKQMSDMMSKKKAIKINNCEITPSRRGEKIEILLKSDSSINESTKNIEVSEAEFNDDTPEEIELAGLQLKQVYARVSVNLRAQKLADLETVRTGKQKQDVYVADHSSTAKVILWEEQVGILHDKT